MVWNPPGAGSDKPPQNPDPNVSGQKPKNEPPKDPWTGRPKSEVPPDLEKMIKDLYQRFLKGVKNKSSNSNTSSDGKPPVWSGKFNRKTLTWIPAALFFTWVVFGIFIIGPAEQGVVLRFGKYVKTVGPGPHWAPPLIDTVYTVNEQKISTYSYSSEMLTQDENIVSVSIAVQYRIDDARNYLFNAVDPEAGLEQATASALRQVIGHTNLDQVLTTGREQIRQQVQDQLSATLARYNIGMLVTDIAVQPAKAPEEVKEAFDDAIKAQEDEQRYENQAESYAMQVVPIAKGQAQRFLADAKAYQQQVALQAKAEVAPFLALLPEYKKASVVTHERLYLEAMENVLLHSSKVFMDTPGSNNMMYLPLDQLLKRQNIPSTANVNTASADTAASTGASSTPYSDVNTTPQGGY